MFLNREGSLMFPSIKERLHSLFLCKIYKKQGGEFGKKQGYLHNLFTYILFHVILSP